jgi:DNA helicase-2/ATP-dependent DNA helicase PcrA
MQLNNIERHLENLNPMQQKAVTLQANESALILAGAGSGKTKVLTTRIAWLINQGIQHQEIMAVTFTNKAAQEMRLRLSQMVNIPIHSLWMGTFHGLAHKFLRIHAKQAKLEQNFQIIDQQDQLSLIKKLHQELKLDEKTLSFRSAQYYINDQKEKGYRARQSQQDHGATALYYLYENYCFKEHLVDFSELLLRACETCSEHPVLTEHYQQRFKQILIDEFQDTNPIQYRWLRYLTGAQTGLFVVGDDDQSIYTFRGADVSHMKNIIQDYHIEHTIRLEQNYRSQSCILEAANALIQNNTQRFGKTLWTETSSGDLIELYTAENQYDEARWVCARLKNIEKSMNDIAILYRSNAQSRVIEEQMIREGIPYRIYGNVRFFERMEIKQALAYVRVAYQPNDSQACLKIINVPTRGIGAKSIEKIEETMHQQNCSFWEALSLTPLSGTARIGLIAFQKNIEMLHHLVHSTHIQLGEQLTAVITHSGLRSLYKNEQERLDHLDELERSANDFAIENDEIPAIIQFLSYAALEAGDNQAEETNHTVQLMTVHAAKGLEFDHVFISGLEEGLFPHGQNQNIEEERRLMYVALTRARKNIYLSHATQRSLHGQIHHARRSRFIDEIPINCMSFGKKFAKVNAIPEKYSTSQYPAAIHTSIWIGRTVLHKKFGEGIVFDQKGDQVCVKFNQDTKWLDLNYASLEVLGV